LPEVALAQGLLTPCQDAESSAGDGQVSRLECTGFVLGLVAALEQAAGDGASGRPRDSGGDQLRRTFAGRVHGGRSATPGSRMPVGVVLLAALDDSFGCS